jgi:hypothetical protein
LQGTFQLLDHKGPVAKYSCMKGLIDRLEELIMEIAAGDQPSDPEPPADI